MPPKINLANLARIPRPRTPSPSRKPASLSNSSNSSNNIKYPRGLGRVVKEKVAKPAIEAAKGATKNKDYNELIKECEVLLSSINAC
ncbi:hypothetical protein C1646_757616 [Rhizophagus diaphanus]|nr:hypothetical protein C1646_757616 [Rhizophagus diaphanus] [Rhizophagus sp. MUCL 43196]